MCIKDFYRFLLGACLFIAIPYISSGNPDNPAQEVSPKISTRYILDLYHNSRELGYEPPFDTTRTFDTEKLYRTYVQKGGWACIEELNEYYREMVCKPWQEQEKEIQKMEDAAREYNNKPLAYEAELLRAILYPKEGISDFENDVTRIKQADPSMIKFYLSGAVEYTDKKIETLNDIIHRAKSRGDRFIQLRAMSYLVDRYTSACYTKYGLNDFLQELEEVSEKEYPLKKRGYYIMGKAFASDKKYTEAIPYLQKALTEKSLYYFDNSNIKARILLGEIYALLNEFDQSNRHFLSLLESKDRSFERLICETVAMNNLGTNLIENNFLEEAIEIFRELIPIKSPPIDFDFNEFNWNEPLFLHKYAQTTDQIYPIPREILEFNKDSLYFRYAHNGYQSCIEELQHFYSTLTHEDVLKEADNMEKTARKYKSMPLLYESEWLRTTVNPFEEIVIDSVLDLTSPAPGIDSTITILEDLIRKSEKDRNIWIRLKSMKRILELHMLGKDQISMLKYAWLFSRELEKVSEEEYPLKRDDYLFLGKLYYSMKDYQKAVGFFKKLLQEENEYYFDNSDLEAREYLGRYYCSKDNKLSIKYLLSILESSQKVKNSRLYNARSLALLAQYIILPDSRIHLYSLALPVFKEYKDYRYLMETCFQMGKDYYNEGEWGKALDFFQKSYNYSFKIYNELTWEERFNFKTLNRIAISNCHFMLGDKIHGKENLWPLEFLISSLDSDPSLLLQVEKEIHRSETLIKDLQIHSQQVKLIGIICFALLSTVASFIIYFLYRKKRKAYHLLTQRIENWATLDQETGEQCSNGPHSPVNKETNREDQEIIRCLKELMTGKSLYMNCKLTLDDVAATLRVSRTNLSRAINNRTGKNFNQYINEYRIKEAIRIFTSEKMKNIFIDELYEEVGFNSRTSFYRAFKQATGLSPTEYRKNIRK